MSCSGRNVCNIKPYASVNVRVPAAVRVMNGIQNMSHSDNRYSCGFVIR